MRRTQERLSNAGNLALVSHVRHECQLEIEPAGADEIAERLEARLDDVALPARDLRPVLAAALRELALRESGPEASLANHHPARHAASLAFRGRNIYCVEYATVTPVRAVLEQLELEVVRTESPEKPRPHRNGSTARERLGPRLAVSPDEAAAVLGVSRDYFDEHVIGELRVVRRGRRILVSLAELERWLDRSATRVSVGGRG